MLADVLDSLDSSFTHLLIVDTFSGPCDWGVAAVSLALETSESDKPIVLYTGADPREWAVAIGKHRLGALVKAGMEAKQIDFEAPTVPAEFAESQPAEWTELISTIQRQLKTFRVKATDGSLVVPNASTFRPQSPEIREALQKHMARAKILGPALVAHEKAAAPKKRGKPEAKKAAAVRVAAEHVVKKQGYVKLPWLVGDGGSESSKGQQQAHVYVQTDATAEEQGVWLVNNSEEMFTLGKRKLICPLGRLSFASADGEGQHFTKDLKFFRAPFGFCSTAAASALLMTDDYDDEDDDRVYSVASILKAADLDFTDPGIVS